MSVKYNKVGESRFEVFANHTAGGELIGTVERIDKQWRGELTDGSIVCRYARTRRWAGVLMFEKWKYHQAPD